MARVSIITRTMNRPQLLARALESVLAQSFVDWQWVVVNGGTPGALEAVLGPRRTALGERVKVVDFTNPKPGMRGVPINIGIQHSTAELITLLDDDDTWEPDFLESMLRALDKAPEGVGGVVCQTRMVEESSVEGGLTLQKDYPLNADMYEITLARLAVVNAFCVHAFMYRRAVWEAIGGYAEDLPVLEDWDFNLRFLSHCDVVVVPRLLSRYHLRPSVSSGLEANSQHAEFDQHKFYESRIINAAIRADMQSGKPGLGALLASAAHARWLERRIHSVEGKVRAASEKIGKIDTRTKAMKDGR